jgi:hypothetical protein
MAERMAERRAKAKAEIHDLRMAIYDLRILTAKAPRDARADGSWEIESGSWGEHKKQKTETLKVEMLKAERRKRMDKAGGFNQHPNQARSHAPAGSNW